MKSIIPVLVLALALSACAGLTDSSRGSTASPSASSQEYGNRDAAREYPYNPAY
jgi:hypothetical protein